MLIIYCDQTFPSRDQGLVRELCSQLGLSGSGRQIENDIKTMLDRGSMYRRLGDVLGGGVCFVLGTALPETHWTKLLTKTTSKFDKVMRHLAKTDIPRLSRQYAGLRDEVINAKFAAFHHNRAMSFVPVQRIPSDAPHDQHTWTDQSNEYMLGSRVLDMDEIDWELISSELEAVD